MIQISNKKIKLLIKNKKSLNLNNKFKNNKL